MTTVATLAGREDALARVRAAAASAAGGTGSVLLVHGAGGCGKSVVVRTGLDGAGLRVVAAPPFRPGAPPLWPLVRALGLTSPTASVADLLAAAAEAAGTGPVAILLDDVHLAEPAAADALLLLADLATSLPLLLVFEWRSDEPVGRAITELRRGLVRADPACEVVVGPLDAVGVAALAEGLQAEPPDDALVAGLLAASGGVPRYVEELVEALGAGASREALPVPPALLERAQGRLERLDGPAREAALAAAALGPEATAELLLGAYGAEALDVAVAARVLAARGDAVDVVGGPAAARALLESASPGERQTLHAALAERLLAAGRATAAARQWLLAFRPDDAAAVLLRAATGSLAAERHAEAAEAALAALPLVHERERPALLAVLAAAVEGVGDTTGATAAWRDAADAAEAVNDHAGAGEARQRLASLLALLGDADGQIQAALAAARSFAAAELPGRAASCRLLAARRLQLGGSLRGAVDAARRAGEEADAAGRPDLAARAAIVEGQTLGKLGETEAGGERVQQALAAALAASLVEVAAEAYVALAVVAESSAEYDAAARAYEEAHGYCATTGADDGGRVCRACLSHVLHITGSWRRAELLAREILDDPDVDGVSQCVATIVAAHVAVSRGSTREAAHGMPLAAEEARRLRIYGAEVEAAWVQARRLVLEDDLDGAAAVCRALLARHAETDDVHYGVRALGWMSTCLAKAGDAASVRRVAEALSTAVTVSANPESLSARARAMGEVALLDGDAATACDHLLRARELAGGSAIPLDRAEITLRAGELLAAHGRQEEAVESLRSAYRTARRLGARPLAAQAAQALRGLGEPTEHHGDPRAGSLSSRELEVLRLVAAGHTNKAVATELFLSPRTVDMHVRRILARLDCRSRAEAVARAGAQGLLD